MNKIEIIKRSENNYTFTHAESMSNDAMKERFYNIFVEGSEDYQKFAKRARIGPGGIRPENIEGLKIVKKGKDDSETKNNLEEFINKLMIEHIRKDKKVEVSISEIPY